MANDQRLWLSRSWTTRPRREGEPESSYVFVDRAAFEQRRAEGGFLEWTEFMGHLYGTPWPQDIPPGHDLVLEVDLEGVRSIRKLHPEAVVVLVVPPSEEVQRARMVARGDPPEVVEQRVQLGRHEISEMEALADYKVVNTDLEQALDELRQIVEEERWRETQSPGS